ncbi:LOW QUALITY PROTEIN: E3 ubiquitin protein ligase DRIP2-like [Populus alba x Populus x berolinensis]|nr:LOW QUALITY PROTEIN: E3 ubiquitin protein ligase DRIP2-like [Populus alba x Populus x berolinensis]
MLGQVVKVQREEIAACLNLSLFCTKLFRDATTISECPPYLKCIYKKITDEELDSCPCPRPRNCASSLKAMPVQEADHSVPLIGRRKERSLSSLSAHLRYPSSLFLTGKRSRPIARKRESPVLIKELEILVQIKKLDAQEKAQSLKTSVKEHGDKSKVTGEESNSTASPSVSMKPRRLQGKQQKRAAPSEGLNIPAQTVVDANSKCDTRFSPIWFSLVASDHEQGGSAPLPQISSCYLRVKDGSLPVSYIKKYLAQKLGLVREAEVEISMRGQPVVSTLQLHTLVDWWLQTASASERIRTTVGSSAKDFVMVLSYGRIAHPPFGDSGLMPEAKDSI